LALCDNYFDVTNSKAIFDERQLDADKDLYCMLHNASSNTIGVVFLGITNSFDFKLFDANGMEIPKTVEGKLMSVGPTSVTNFAANPYIGHMGGPPETLSAGAFPHLTNLFQFPSDGLYIFELRYWAWINSKNRFVLSDPVRLRVIKKDSNNALPVQK
jgi:hypothetical protein